MGLTILLVFLAEVGVSVLVEGALTKTWVRTWDVSANHNWERGRAPCGGRDAVLPWRPDFPVLLSGSISTRSLVLPLDGEVILGQDSSLNLIEAADPFCKGAGSEEASEWSHEGQDSWWDSDAWSSSNNGIVQQQQLETSAVPHVHRVPCSRDTVVFPEPSESLYTLELGPSSVSVAHLFIGNQSFSTSAFASYLTTTEGIFRFVTPSEGSPLLYVEESPPCEDVTGCPCDTKAAAHIICHLATPKCPPASCVDPISMEGFCCPTCGSDVIIRSDGTLSLAKIKTLLMKLSNTSVAGAVNTYAAKMDDGHVHVFITAKDSMGDYRKVANEFKLMFDKELNLNGKQFASVQSAGRMKRTWPTGGPAPHSIAAALITLVICLALAATIYYFRKRRSGGHLGFMFRRLESGSRRVSVVGDPLGRRVSCTSVYNPAYSRESGLRFFNPIFNQSMASLAAINNEPADGSYGSTDQSPEDQLESHRVNPTYTALQGMSLQEQQAADKELCTQNKIVNCEQKKLDDASSKMDADPLATIEEEDQNFKQEENATNNEPNEIKMLIEPQIDESFLDSSERKNVIENTDKDFKLQGVTNLVTQSAVESEGGMSKIPRENINEGQDTKTNENTLDKDLILDDGEKQQELTSKVTSEPTLFSDETTTTGNTDNQKGFVSLVDFGE